MPETFSPRSHAAPSAVLILILSLTSGCVPSARHQEVAAERDRLARENLELRRSLAEQQVRTEEALEALPGWRPPQAARADRPVPPDARGVEPAPPAPPRAVAPEGFASSPPAIMDEDLRTTIIPGPETSEGAEGILRVARRYAAAGRVREAIDAYNRLIDDYPFSPLLPEAFLGRGRLRLSGGDSRGALADFDTVAEAFPASGQAREARRQAEILRSR